MSNVLSTGTSALLAFQRALSTVSHNVANLNTPGYSRQRVDFAARNPTDVGVGHIGQGTRIQDINRVVDELANARLIDSGGELARLEQLSSLSSRVDSLMSDPATGITGAWSGFFDSVSALSADPSASARRQDLLGQASALSARFQQIQGQFDQLSREVDGGLRAGADEVNRLASEISELNAKISGRKAAPDLLDRRDQLVGELVALTGGSAVSQDGTSVNVFTAGGQALVVGTQASRLGAVADPYRPERTQLVLESPGQASRLDERALGGRIGGLLEFRSQVLDPAQGELGRVALGLAHSFNEAHARGMDQYGAMGGEFFRAPTPKVSAHAGNTGGANLSAAASDPGAITGRDVVLQWRDGAWSATDATSGGELALTGSGTADAPLLVAGVSITFDGAPASGDRFLVQPTAHAAGVLDVAISDPARIAAAAPMRVEADLGNVGSGKPGAVTAADPDNPMPAHPATIEFIDGDQYTVDGAGPYPYVPGETIHANGWSFTLDGAPGPGDRFGIGPTGAGSSDNGNALLLAAVDDLRGLDGGSLSLNGAIAGLTTSVGSAARQAGYAAEAQGVLHTQAQAARDSVSGVNLDEEAANMLRLQQAYQAAAQIIATADSMFQTLLGTVRR